MGMGMGLGFVDLETKKWRGSYKLKERMEMSLMGAAGCGSRLEPASAIVSKAREAESFGPVVTIEYYDLNYIVE